MHSNLQTSMDMSEVMASGTAHLNEEDVANELQDSMLWAQDP